MLISYNWLKEFISDLAETPAEVAEKLSRSLAEVEDVRKVGNDYILEIENKALGHRPDLFGMVGLAREAAAALRRDFVTAPIKTLDPTTGDLDLQTPITITLPSPPSAQHGKRSRAKPHTPPLCSRYSAVVLRNIRVGPSPAWLQEQLQSVGLRPVNNIVDITNHLMYKYGQPLHAFDLVKLLPIPTPPKPSKPLLHIVVRLAHTNETLTLLDKTNLTLTQNDLVIANQIENQSEPIALAGIMGGQAAEITDQTTDILLESANFDMYTIRASSRRHAIRSDASLRFEKGLDPVLTVPVLQEAIQMITGQTGKVGVADEYPHPRLRPAGFAGQAIPPAPPIPLTLSQINYYLNVNLSLNETLSLLNRLDLLTKTEGETKILVTPPTFRPDLRLPEDLYEEIGRLYDYNKIEPTLPTHVTHPPQENKTWTFKNRLRAILKNLGLAEVLNYSFVDQGITDLKLENPVAPEFAYLRSSLVPGLTANTIENAKRFNEFGLFELGLVTLPAKDKNALPIEPELLGLVFYSRSMQPEATLIQVKSVWRTLLVQLNITNDLTQLIPVELKLGDPAAGRQDSAFGYEIDIATLYEAAQPTRFQLIPPSPPTTQDLSFIIDENLPIGEVIEEIKSRGGIFLTNVELTDVFQNDQFKKDKKKSVTVRLTFQHPQHSLADKEINPVREEIEKYLRETYHAQIR